MHYTKDEILAPDSERGRNMTHTTREVDLHSKDTNILGTWNLGVDEGGSDWDGHFVGCWRECRRTIQYPWLVI